VWRKEAAWARQNENPHLTNPSHVREICPPVCSCCACRVADAVTGEAHGMILMMNAHITHVTQNDGSGGMFRNGRMASP
jgi:hypothetical protein